MRRLTARQRLAAILLAAVAVCFITLDAAGGSLRGAHGGVQGALGSLYRGTDSVLGPTRRFVQALPDAEHNQRDNQQLQQQNAALRAQVAANAENAATTKRLAALQLRANAGHYQVVPARVIAFGPGAGFEWTATLDVGTASGVKSDQTVTDGNALIGRVVHVSAASSVVLLGADPTSGVGVRDTRDGQLGVATGRGTRGYTLDPLDPAASVKVGDQLRTGPAGSSSYVADLAVGTVTAVRTAADGTTTADVRAAASPTSLDLVGVILVGGTSSSPRPALTPGGSAPTSLTPLAGGR
jgi:rod shape-determining protein MreC